MSAELGNKTQAAVRALIEEAAANEHAKPGTDLQKVRDLCRSHMDAVRIDPIRKHVDRAGASTNRLGCLIAVERLTTAATREGRC